MSQTTGRAAVPSREPREYPAAPQQMPPRGNPYSGKKKLRPRWGRIALLAGLAVLIIATIVGISLYGYASNLDGDLKRTDAFSGLTGDRPGKSVEGAQNILLVGSDSRDPSAKEDEANAWRADTL